MGFTISVLGFLDPVLDFVVSALWFGVLVSGFVVSVLSFVVSVLGFLAFAPGSEVFDLLCPGQPASQPARQPKILDSECLQKVARKPFKF